MKIKLDNFIMNLIIPISVAIFNILIILYPKQILGAAKDGISLWFNNIFPSLLPFIIGTNILIGLGVVSFIGTLLQPIMYPIFRVPGCGGFALVVGITSGYPMGAKVTSNLVESGELSRNEAQRLASFCNNSGPLFVLGAVAVSMFGSVTIGYFILAIHYLGALLTGLIFRNYKKEPYQKPVRSKNILNLAARNMVELRRRNNKNFGEILGDSVRNAMETILLVGGFVILFCVIVKVLEITGITHIVVHFLTPVASKFNIGEDILAGIFVGSIEITNGIKILSGLEFSKTIVIISAGIISFSGISIIAQASSFFGKTNISVPIYVISKILHSAITIILGFLLAPFFKFEINTVYHASSLQSQSILDKFMYSSLYFISGLIFIAVMALFAIAYKKIKPFR